MGHSMQSTDKIAVVEKYIQAFANNDISLIKEIYAEDATVEDPVGSEVRHGIPAIVEFYQQGFGAGAKLEITGTGPAPSATRRSIPHGEAVTVARGTFRHDGDGPAGITASS